MARIWATLIGYVFGNILSAMLVGRFALHVDPGTDNGHVLNTRIS